MADKDFVVKNGLVVNTSFLANSTGIYYSGVQLANTTAANNASYLGGQAPTYYASNSTVYSTFAQNTAIYQYSASNSTVYSTFAQNTSVYSTFAQNTSVYSTFAQNTSVYSTFAQNTSVYSTFAQLSGAIFTGSVSTTNNFTIGTSSYFVTNGNIGIGNSTPVTKFQIDGNYGIKSTTLSAGNNHNINCASGNYFIVTCNSSSQNVYFTNAPSGTAYGMIIRFANGSGGNTLSWANTPKWPSATAPTASTNNDIWVFLTDDGGTTWRGNQTMKDVR